MLGIFDWNKIYDPKKEVIFEFDAFDRIEEYNDPQDVQDMFDEYGVEDAIKYINREYLARHGNYAAELVVEGGHKTLRRVHNKRPPES